jgi:hypothetical protein
LQTGLRCTQDSIFSETQDFLITLSIAALLQLAAERANQEIGDNGFDWR